jgi:RND family efflux transporter MFP subunit
VKSLIGKWPLLQAVFLLLAAVGGCAPHDGAAGKEEEHSEDGEAHVAVSVQPARLAAQLHTIDGLGRCEALPHQIATLTPAVEGHVHELLVAQGDVVMKGQPIVELDKLVAQADLAEKTATRDGLKASLALLKSLPRPAERRANELAVQQAKLAVEQAKIVADRLRPLVRLHDVSEQNLLDAERAVRQALIQQETAQATLDAMMIGPRPEAVAEAEGKIKTADGLVAFSRAHLDYHTIRAPIDGVLDSLTCHPGQTIAIGTPIGEVVDTRHVFGSVWLPPRAASSVALGQAARIEPADARETRASSAHPGKDELTGKVAFVGKVADPQTGNLPIRVLVDNSGGRLTIGETLRVSIVVDEKKSVLQVPAGAIVDLGEGPVLSVVRDGKTVVLHPEVGAAHDGWVAISGSDLKEGEPVIVEGGYNLPADTPVKVEGASTSASASASAGTSTSTAPHAEGEK